MPITSLDIVYGKNATAPSHYEIIYKDLNKGARGEFVYLCYSTEASEGDPITDIYVASISTKDYGKNYRPPRNYEMIRKDLNKGARGRFIYLCYTRDTRKGAKPITGVDVIQGSIDVKPPNPSWTRVEQDCSEGANGDYTFIIYKTD